MVCKSETITYAAVVSFLPVLMFRALEFVESSCVSFANQNKQDIR
jgi:hypothetical protein